MTVDVNRRRHSTDPISRAQLADWAEEVTRNRLRRRSEGVESEALVLGTGNGFALPSRASQRGRPKLHLGDLCARGHVVIGKTAMPTPTGWRCRVCFNAARRQRSLNGSGSASIS